MIRYIFLLTIVLLLPFESISQKGKKSRTYHYNKLLASSGRTVKGKRHGEWIYWNRNGEIQKIVTYQNGVLSGPIVMYKSEDFYMHDSADFIPIAEANYSCFIQIQKEDYRDTIITGFLENGKKSGKWSYFQDGGKHIERTVEFKDDQFHGESIEYYGTGKVREKTQYQNGLKNGTQEKFRYDGQFESMKTYKNDTLHGPFHIAQYGYSDGKKGNYKMGVLDGKQETYNESRNTHTEVNYLDGKRHGRSYSKNSGQETEYHYKGDTLNGPYWSKVGAGSLTDFHYAFSKVCDDYEIDPAFYNDLQDVLIKGDIREDGTEMSVYSSDNNLVGYVFAKQGNRWRFSGKVKLFNEGRTIFEGQFVNGQPDSLITVYFPNGRIRWESDHIISTYNRNNREYSYSTCLSDKRYYDNGKLMMSFDHEKREKTAYWKNGKKRYTYRTQSYTTPYEYIEEKYYNEAGKLTEHRKFDITGGTISIRNYSSNSDSLLSSFDDEHFDRFFIFEVEEIEEVVEMMPEEIDFPQVDPRFPGGNDQFNSFLLDKNPLSNPNSGKIAIQFKVSKAGEVKDIHILSDEVGDCIAIQYAKVIQKSPKWRSAQSRGRPVDSIMQLDINIRNGTASLFLELVSLD